MLRRVSSDWLPQLLHAGRDDKAFLLVWRRVPGTSLAARLRDGALPLPDALRVGRCLFSALRDLHHQRLLHRGVFPSHLILTGDDPDSANVPERGASHIPPARSEAETSPRAILVDFGATAITESKALQGQHWLEIAACASPEQAGLLDQDVSEVSDLYSAGVVLFHCLAGEPPYRGETVGTILFEHMTATIPQLRGRGIAVPRALDELVQRLLCKDPRDRYQSAEAVLADLDAISAALDAGQPDPRIVIGSADRRGTLTEPAFVARTTELQELQTQIERTRQGQGGLVLIEAESGGGKTRLLTEAAHRGVSAGLWVVRGLATTEVAQQPLSLLQGIVDSVLVRMKSTPGFGAVLRHRLREEAAILQAAMPTLAQAFPDSSENGMGPESAGETRTVQALLTFLEALGTPETPALIILDDCQWGDELVFKLLRRWQSFWESADQRERHVVVLVAFRSEEVTQHHALRKVASSAHLRLAPLLAPEVRQLAESMAGRLPNDAVELITSLADGSPFMTSAVLRGLVESQALVSTPEGWRTEPLALADLQSSNRAGVVLARRLELLPAETLHLLCACAVLGKEFELNVASYLAGQTPSQSIIAFDEARARRLVWTRPDGQSAMFVHDKVRAALLDRLEPTVRQELHRAAARFLQQHLPERVSELAYHFDAAGDTALALPYALQAGELARQRHALEIAEQQYQIAVRGAADTDVSRRYEVSTGLGDVLLLRGKYDAAEQTFSRAAGWANGTLPRAQIRGKLAELAFKRGDMQRAVDEFEAALRDLGCPVPRTRAWGLVMLVWEVVVQMLHTLLPWLFVNRLRRDPTAAERLTLQLCSGLAHGRWYCCNLSVAMWAHLRGLNLAERYRPTPELAHAYSEHAPAMTLVPWISRATRYVERSLTIRRANNDLWGQGQSLHYYGIVLYAASRYEECIQKCREAVRLLERMGDYWQVHIARYQIAVCLYRLGDLRGAIEESQLNHRSGLLLGDEQASGIILDVWARAAFGAVPDHILQTELDRERRDPQGATQVLLAHGIQLLARGQLQEAAETLQRAVANSDSSGVRNPYTMPALTWAATAWRTLAEATRDVTPIRRLEYIGRAERAARRAIWYARTCRNELPQAFRELALVRALQGRTRAARRLFQKSFAESERQHSLYETALTRVAQARIDCELGKPGANLELAEAETRVNELSLPRTAEEKKTTTSLSLVDRFDTVLDAGRKIAAGLQPAAIFQTAHDSALRLLHSEHCVVLELDCSSGDIELRPVAGGIPGEVDLSLLERSLELHRAVTLQAETERQAHHSVRTAGTEGSAMCVPLHCRGTPVACLYVTHRQVQNLFGEDEERLADFIATIAGAALENSEGFAQLESLNLTLEQRVTERTAAAESRAQELALTNAELERIAQELRDAQAQLSIAKLAAESASEAKSRFLATMSHEIRTPMNGVIGMTELALRTTLSDQQRNFLRIVKDSANALLSLLNDVLDFSKIEAGRMELECIPFELREVVVDAARVLAINASRKNLELICRIDPRLPRMLAGDPNRLRQILVNLIGNAIKFTEKGEIVVHVSLEAHREAGYQVHLAVKDSGLGIPQDRQHLIFEAFRQSDSSTTRRFGGTGLGLSISAQLAALMQGRIWVESEPGQGSTFHVLVELDAVPEDLPTATLTGPIQGARVLLVSPHPQASRAYAELLEHEGHTVITAANAEEALLATHWQAHSAPYDVAVVDAAPLDDRTREFVTRLSQPEFGERMPIVLLVAPTSLGETEHLRDLGVAQCLTKPVKPSELNSALQSAIGTQAEDGSAPAHAGGATQRLLRILVADDSPVNQEVAGGLLEMHGHTVTLVDDGQAAVEAWRAQEFDLIFLDFEMPILDGLAATRIIREEEAAKGTHIPILAMTAHALQTFRDQCFAAGMDGYVTKPIQLEELLEAIAEACPAEAVEQS